MLTRARTYGLAVLLLAGMTGTPSSGWAQADAKPNTVGYQRGEVTYVRSSSIEINGRSYELKSNVEILDDEGNPLKWDRVVPTSLVKFHLKEGHIDKMVVTLPQ